MNVSMGIMLMWVIACTWMIFCIKAILSPKTEIPKIKDSDKEAVIGLATIFALILGGFHIIYAIITAGIVSNVFFTLISAILILGWVVTILQVFVKLGQFINGQLVPDESKITWWTFLKIVHLAWFGYFILFK